MGHRPCAATDFQYARPLWNVRLSQVRVEHRLLLWVGGAKFQDAHNAFEDFRGRVRDGSKDIRQGVYLLLTLPLVTASFSLGLIPDFDTG